MLGEVLDCDITPKDIMSKVPLDSNIQSGDIPTTNNNDPNVDSDDDMPITVKTKSRKIYVSEDEESDSLNNRNNEFTKDVSDGTQSSDNESRAPKSLGKPQKRIRKIAQSGSESEKEVLDINIENDSTKECIANLFEENSEGSGSESYLKASSKKNTKISNFTDSEDDEISGEKDNSFSLRTTNDESKNLSGISKFPNKDVYDAEGSSDEEYRSNQTSTNNHSFDNNCQIEKENKSSKSKVSKKKNNPPRKSKQSALEEIISENQRLVRQSRVSLPYHQPKQYSLAEFLSRRKVPVIPLKTSSADLSKVWQCIEEREKTAEEFFKSDSDSNEDDCQKASYETKDAEQVDEKSNLNNADSELKSVSDTGTDKDDTDTHACGNNCDKSSEISMSSENPLENSCPSLLSDNAKHSFSQSAKQTNGNLGEFISETSAHKDVNNDDSMKISSNKSLETGLFSNLETPSNSTFDTDGPADTPTDQSKVIFCEKAIISSRESCKTKPNETEKISFEFLFEKKEEIQGDLEESECIINSSLGKSKEELTNKCNDVKEGESNTETDCSEKVDPKKKIQSLLSNSLLEVDLDSMPKISSASDGFIDLDEVSEKPKALQLVTRFMKHVKLKPRVRKQEEKMSVAITEYNAKGELVNVNEEILNIKVGENVKPGETRNQLKARLKEQIAQRREVEFVKRVEEYKMSEEFLEESTANQEEDEDIEEEIELTESSESESEPEENDMEIIDKPNKSNNPFVEEEAEETEDEEDKEMEEKDGNESEEDEKYKDTQSVDSCSIPNIAGLINEGDETPSNLDLATPGTEAENGLLRLCSGVFPTENFNLEDLEKNDKNESEQLQSEPLDLYLSEDAIMDVIDSKKQKVIDQDSSDDELLPKKTKKKVKLTFSDDEDDNEISNKNSGKGDNESEDVEAEEEINEDEEELQSNDDEENDVSDEDSENEVVEDEEEEIIKNPSEAAKRFLEDEAELSGSEYGSGDEDEVNLDKYEEEQGDQDKFNPRSLQTELEKLHMQNILADDNHQIKLLQEVLLEDGELHSDGPKRQRQFRWYNQDENDMGGFVNNFDDDEDFKEGENEEEDESWRKTRLERESFLKTAQIDEDIEMDKMKNFARVEVMKAPTPKTSLTKTPKQFTSPDPKKQFTLTCKRGSFLNRGAKMLSKLAEITNVAKENPSGNASKGRNMVFAIVSPPKQKELSDEQQTAKRKTKEPLPAAKRLKFAPLDPNKKKGSVFEKLRNTDL